jgi:DUF4097 and DUF4098 domain-containing protein YvlB
MTAITQPLQKVSLGSALALFLVGSEAHADVTREVFEVEEGGHLVLDAAAGSVNVCARNIDVVEVLVERRGVLPHPTLVMEQEGNDVYIESRDVPVLDWLPGWAWRPVHFEVSVPIHYSVEIETRRGRVRIEDARGRVEARTRRGRLSFRNIEGPIEGRAAGGTIEVDGCSGDVDLVAQGGSIRVEHVEGSVSAHTRGGRLQVRDSAGDLELQSAGGPIHIVRARGSVMAHSRGGSIYVSFDDDPEGQLETSGGSIDVWFPADEGARLEAQTHGGSIDVEHPVELEGVAARGHLEGTVNGGGEPLRLHTRGGSIRVRAL